MVGKVWFRVDHPENFDDRFYPRKLTERRFRDSQQLQACQPRSSISVLNRDVPAQAPNLIAAVGPPS